MKKTVTIELDNLPPALNSLYRYGKGNYYLSREAKDWKDLMYFTAMNAMIKAKLKPFIGLITMSIELFYKRNRDIDSSIKCLLDSLQKVCYKNDIQINDLHIKKIKSQKPGLLITISQ